MFAHAMPTTFEWIVMLTVWFAWLWLPIVFIAIVVWRKRIDRPVAWCFLVAEVLALSIGLRLLKLL